MLDREATNAIRRLAEVQHGVVSRQQLLEQGLGRQLIDARLASGLLVAVHEGVFAVGHSRLSREGKWLAAVLATGSGAVLSHGSAAQLWGIGEGSRRPEVTRRSGGTTRATIWIHQTRSLPEDHVKLKAGVPVTSVERTVLDLAARTRRRPLERMLADASRAGILKWPRLWQVIEWGVGRKGRGLLRQVARDLDPHSHAARSPLEVDFLALCRRAGLPSPQVNVFVEGHLVDFLWLSARLVVETDGYAFHSDRGAFERDRRRDLDLAAAGYEVSRLTYQMVRHEPDRCIDVVRSALDRRGASNLPLERRQI